MAGEWSIRYYTASGLVYYNCRTGIVVRADELPPSQGVVLSRPHAERESVPPMVDALDVQLSLAIAEAMLDA